MFLKSPTREPNSELKSSSAIKVLSSLTRLNVLDQIIQPCDYIITYICMYSWNDGHWRFTIWLDRFLDCDLKSQIKWKAYGGGNQMGNHGKPGMHAERIKNRNELHDSHSERTEYRTKTGMGDPWRMHRERGKYPTGKPSNNARGCV